MKLSEKKEDVQMEPTKLSECVNEIAQAPHEIYWYEVTLEERVELARNPWAFLHNKGIPVQSEQKVTLNFYYEPPPKGRPIAGYLIATYTPENVILACVNCDYTSSIWSHHA